MSPAEKRRQPDRGRGGADSPLSSRKRILDALMSGNSGRSCARTSPMPNWPRAGCSLMGCFPSGPSRAILRAPAARIGRGRVRAQVLAGQEQQPELADLDFVPSGQLGFLDTLPVDVGALQAAHVPDGVAAALALELRVPPGDGHVVQE